MRTSLFLLLLLLSSCGTKESSSQTSLLSKQSEQSLKNANLTNDDILILEIHYPSILQKIVIHHSLSPQEVLILHDIGLNGETLIHLIKYTKSNYMLTTDDVISLQLGGVPFEVINFMIKS